MVVPIIEPLVEGGSPKDDDRIDNVKSIVDIAVGFGELGLSLKDTLDDDFWIVDEAVDDGMLGAGPVTISEVVRPELDITEESTE